MLTAGVRVLFALVSVSSMILARDPTMMAAPPSQGNAFADPAFEGVWARTDAPVQSGRVARSFYWGPQPNGGPLMEDFAEGPGGKHLVQYFDKGRMEINDPNGDKSNPFYVTTGLLTMEMISGYIQTGAGSKQDHYRAEIPVAGDMDDANAPTYASLRDRLTESNPRPLGETLTSTIDRAGAEGSDARYGSYNVKIAVRSGSTDQLRHNIPDVFWTFLNLSGPVIVDGRQGNARLSDPWFYVTGYPVTEAYWTNVKIDGKPTDVLLQAYERRVLTYVPSLPAGWQVQMGNIGQHYYDWRYNNAGRPTGANCTTPPEGKLGTLWSGNTTLQLQLGCPLGPDAPGTHFPTTIAIAHFQHGHMIDRISQQPGAGGGTVTFKQIYVLYDDGTLEQYPDLYDPSQPQPTPPTAPSGFYAPTLGFGKVWAEQTGVRDRLGWATAPESVPADAGVQWFEKGLVVYGGAVDGRFYALYNAAGLTGSPDRWAGYDASLR